MTPDEAEARIETLLAHRAWLRTLAARLVGSGLADDLVQETWLAALRRPPDPARAARPWLATVARRLARRLKRTREIGRAGAEPPDPAPPTDELLARVELETDLAREVARLSEPFRRTVLLRYHEGLRSAEIARREGVPAGTVRWRLKHGLDELRTRLDARFGERKSWATAFAPLAALATGGPGAGVAALSWGRVAGVAAAAMLLAGAGAWRLARPGGAAMRDAKPREAAALVAAPGADAPDAPGTAPPRPAAEPEPAARRPVEVAATAAPAPGMRVRFVEWDGTPSAGRLTALRVSADEVRSAQTDADGVVAFTDVGAPARGLGGAVTIAHDRLAGEPFVTEIEPRDEEYAIELPRGRTVSGRVLVDGAPPDPLLAVELYRADAPGRWRTDNPEARAWSLLAGDVTLRATTAPDGGFAFVGLEEDWRGIVVLPPGFAPPESIGYVDPGLRHTLFLAEPTDGIEIALARHRTLFGRVLESDGVTPTAFASLLLSVTWSDGTGMHFSTAVRDSDGRFAIFPERWPVRRISLEAAGRDARGRVERVFEADDIGADGDLGDVVLALGREVTLLVSDTEGRPIEGAAAAFSAARSDATGRLVLAGFTERTDLAEVAARGFAPLDVSVPAGATEIAVVLTPTNELRVHVRDAEGAPVEGLTVEVGGTTPLFEGGQGGGAIPPGAHYPWFDQRWVTTRTPDDAMIASFRTGADGRFAVGGLRAGVPVRVVVRSSEGAAIAERALDGIGVSEVVELELETAALRALPVRVTDEGGEPVRGASVRLFAAPDGSVLRAGGQTDAMGRVGFRHLSAPAYRVDVGHADYLPRVLEGVRAGAAEDAPLEIRLVRGLAFTVRVEDDAGRAIGGGKLSYASPSRDRGSAEESAAGRFPVRGVPDAPLELRLDLAGRVFRQPHDPRVAEARFVVPAPGAVTVGWAMPPGAGWGEWIDVALVAVDPVADPDAGAVMRPFLNTPAGETTFAPVFPGTYRAEVLRERDDFEGGEGYDVLARSPNFAVTAGGSAGATVQPLNGR
jgi:RNA polymerase sigma-70 factor (ECF subfamily)